MTNLSYPAPTMTGCSITTRTCSPASTAVRLDDVAEALTRYGGHLTGRRAVFTEELIATAPLLSNARAAGSR
ncbi:hypothetical protein [Actinoplanes sp. TFC3]|uniref:hypothetical protein n=1 Tax=Actinoplanes sp. TFC3 TaxID=1710355 RepID=UPI000836D26D|nr:hypothetical protein [Actinoplanes sp. TFC3]